MIVETMDLVDLLIIIYDVLDFVFTCAAFSCETLTRRYRLQRCSVQLSNNKAEITLNLD